MKPLAPSRELPAYLESAEASAGLPETGEGNRLAALLVMLVPFALAAWFAIGLGIYRYVT
jgi:hypothetical protein